MPGALLAAALPLYPGLGQAPNMLACIPSGIIGVAVYRLEPLTVAKPTVSEC